MFAVLWRSGKADVSVFVDPTLIDKEVLVDFHNSCENKQAVRISWQDQSPTVMHIYCIFAF